MPVLDSRADRISVHNYHVRSDGSALQAFRFDDKVFAAVSFIFANTTDKEDKAVFVSQFSTKIVMKCKPR